MVNEENGSSTEAGSERPSGPTIPSQPPLESLSGSDHPGDEARSGSQDAAPDGSSTIEEPAEQASSEHEDFTPQSEQKASPEDKTDGVDAARGPARLSDAQVIAESQRRTRRSFLVGGVAAAGAYGFYHSLGTGKQINGLPALLEQTYDANAQLSRALLDQHALAPTYPLARAEKLRVNGVYGLKHTLKPESYRLQIVGVKDAGRHPRFVRDVTTWEYEYEQDATHEDQGHDTKVDPARLAATTQDGKGDQEEDELHTGRKPRGQEESGESYSTLRPGTPGLLLELDDFLPHLERHELVTQFKCIEGWSQIVQWAGIRLADFLERYPPALIDGKEPKYVYMETPDGDYYVGYDLAVCRHPQTLLVTEMMGAPLTQFHGAPLRVHMPTKYGYKQIKRVALIAYTNEKPDDYWTELGDDWYGGL